MNKKTKEKTKKSFYKLWWFWLIIGVIFVGSWFLFFISNLDVRTSIIGILGVWGSTIATIFIGIIAAKQNENFNFIMRKQQLINEVGENIISFQQGYFEVLDLKLIYTLNREIRKIYKITDQLENLYAQSDLLGRIISYHNNIQQFKVKIIKTNFDYNKLTTLLNNISELDTFIINKFRSDIKLTDPQEANQQFDERLNCIHEITKKIILSQGAVIDYAQNLKLRILSTSNLTDLIIIEKEILENQTRLLTGTK